MNKMPTVLHIVVISILLLAVFWGVFTDIGEHSSSNDEDITYEEYSNKIYICAIKVYLSVVSSIFVLAQYISLLDRNNPETIHMTFADRYVYYISKVIHFFF